MKVLNVLPKLLENVPKSILREKCPVLMEVICNGELKRPLQLDELLLPTILKWTDWTEEERKNNQLVYCNHDILEKLFSVSQVRFLKYYTLEAFYADGCMFWQAYIPRSVFEVHYASPKTKNFRQCPFEFCQARFTLLKDLKVWNIL